MKLIFPLKTIGIIALVAAIATPSLQQPASAQAQDACSIASANFPKGGIYDGVNLSPTQQSAFDAFDKPRNATFIRLNQRAKRVTETNAAVMFFPKQGVTIPPDLKKKIAELERVVKPAQTPSLNAKYGQYGRFNPATKLVYSQALFEEYEREMKLLEDRSLEIRSIGFVEVRSMEVFSRSEIPMKWKAFLSRLRPPTTFPLNSLILSAYATNFLA
jgi:hypothetical protein